jgi:putative peptide zinc metalloprotease protein
MARAQLHSEDWYRVSSLCPRLKPQVDIALHEYRNAPWYVLTDNSSGRSFRLPAEDYEILRRFDGETRIDNIWNDLSWGRSRDLPPQDEFLELLSRLYEAGVIAVDALPRFAGLAKGQRDKSREWITRFMRSPVSQKVPLFNPSQLLEGPALTRLAHLVFGPLGVLVLIATVLGGVYTAVSYWTPLTANLGDRVLEPNNLLIIALVYPFVKLLHEKRRHHVFGLRADAFCGRVSSECVSIPRRPRDCDSRWYFSGICHCRDRHDDVGAIRSRRVSRGHVQHCSDLHSIHGFF